VGLSESTQLSDYGQLLYQANLATEMYAMTPKAQRQNLAPILEAFELPKDLWQTLDQVDTQI
ncbi:MAG TPA: hypothetical protein VIC26_10270, partial [Marinagarivorans sp.]